MLTHATGKRAVQFDVDKNASLAASHILYSQELPPAHQQPEKPTFIKDVNVANAVTGQLHQQIHIQY